MSSEATNRIAQGYEQRGTVKLPEARTPEQEAEILRKLDSLSPLLRMGLGYQDIKEQRAKEHGSMSLVETFEKMRNGEL